MTRRQALTLAGTAPAWVAGISNAAPAARRMGGSNTAFANRLRAAREAKKPVDLVEHCHSIGLGGVETRLPSFEPADIKRVREQLEKYEMFYIGDYNRLPQNESEVAAFETTVRAVKEAGATTMRTALTGRRYEVFDSVEAFKKHWANCEKGVSLAEPVARKHGIKIGIENHKDWRYAEHIAWLKRIGSEWIGVTVDIGNNIALCDDPMEMVEAYAPYAVNVHIKDMGVDEYPDGFLLAEVPLGEGILDLKKIVEVFRKANPNVTFMLEMITRDPLQVPVLTEKYWATFDGSSPLPGRDLAHTLAMVRKKRAQKPFQRIGNLSLEEQVKAEDANNLKCIAYARENLGL